MHRPLTWLMVLLVAGILCYRSTLFCVLGAVILVALLISSFFYIRKEFKESVLLLMLAFFGMVMFFAGNNLSNQIIKTSKIEYFLSDTGAHYVDVCGKVCDLKTKDDKVIVTLKVSELSVNQKISGVTKRVSLKDVDEKVVITLTEETAAQLKCGVTVAFNAQLELYNPAFNDGGFDSRYYYKTRNITAKAEPKTITILSKKTNLGGKFDEALRQVRKYAISNILSKFSDEEAGVIISLLTGDKTYLDSDIKELYQSVNFSHILAVSGLHISLLCLGLYELLKRLGMGQIAASILTLCFLGLFTIFTGMQVSCMRAGIMLAFNLAARCMGRHYDPLSALSGAAILILFKQPMYLYDASFLMSFSAGLGIIFANFIIQKTELLIESEMIKKVVKAALFALLLQVFMLPVQLHFFYKFCPYSIVLNLILLPLMEVLVAFSIVAVVLPVGGDLWALVTAGLSIVNGVICIPAKLILLIYKEMCKLIAGLPGSSVVTGCPSLGELIFVALVFLIFTWAVLRFGHVLAYAFLIPLILLARKPNFETPVFYQLYVGQGDCCVCFYGDKAIMIDCGSSDKLEVYHYDVEKFLNYHGFSCPNYVFVSHADTDHVGGVCEMVRIWQDSGEGVSGIVGLGQDGEEGVSGMNDLNQDSEERVSGIVGLGQDGEEDVGDEQMKIFIPKLDDSSGFDELRSLVNNCDDASLTELQQWQEVKIGNLTFLVVYPDESNNSESMNETSMCLYVNYGEFDALFTGDIDKEAEMKIVELMAANPEVFPTSFELLKVAHHGSRYSSCEEFLKRVSPDAAVISAGIDNSYGHPHAEVIERLEAEGCEVFRTDKEGAVIFQPKDRH